MNRHSLLQTTTRLLLGFFAISALQGWNSNAQSPERFVPTGNMTTVRVFHTATLLKDGRVLIAGGELTNNRSDPVSLTLLRNGTVLITGGGYNTPSAELYLPPPPPLLAFERMRLRAGESFTATFSETHVSDDTYCDLRFRAPGDTAEYLALNWQRGRSATHNVATGIAAGTWTVTGVRPHKDIDDHNGDFDSVSVELQVIR